MAAHGVTLGDVLAFRGEPENVYAKGASLIGDERVAALAAWGRGEAQGFTFWFAPYHGPALRLGGEDWRLIREWDYYFPPAPEGATVADGLNLNPQGRDE